MAFDFQNHPEIFWIWGRDSETSNQYMTFVREFGAKAGEAKLYLSCDTVYTCSLDGQFLGVGQLADYPEDKVYEIHDLKFPEDGNHTLSVTVYWEGEDSSCHRKGTPCLRFAVTQEDRLLVGSDHNTHCVPYTDYRFGPVNKLSQQLCYSFAADLTGKPRRSMLQSKELDIAPRLLPREMPRLTVLPPAEGKLVAQGIFLQRGTPDPLYPGAAMQKAFLSPEELKTIATPFPEQETMEPPVAPLLLDGQHSYTFSAQEGDGIYLVIDMEQEISGYVTFDLTVKTATPMEIGFGEHLDDLRVRTSVGGRDFAASVLLRPGRNQFTHWYKRVGLRYLQVHIHAPTFVLKYVGIRPAEYPLKYYPYHRKDRLEEKIYQTSLLTLQACMHDHYEDCPWREQALYSMDSRTQMLCGYYTFGTKEAPGEFVFPKYSLQLISKAMREDGLLELCSPAKVGACIPAFTLIFVKQVEEYLEFSKDEATVREFYPVIRQILENFTKRAENNQLLRALPGFWNFYEWRPGLDCGEFFGSTEEQTAEEMPFDAPLNAFFSIALAAGANLAEKLGEDDDSIRWRILRTRLNQATHDYFWDAGKEYYQTRISSEWQPMGHFAQLTGALLLYCGAVPKEYQATVREKLAFDTSLIPVSLSHSIFRYESLLQEEKYREFVLEDIAAQWGKMLFAGAKTFWETADGAWDFDNAGSLCHGWSAVPAYIYRKYFPEG